MPIHVGRRDGPRGKRHSYVNLTYVEMLVAERDAWRDLYADPKLEMDGG